MAELITNSAEAWHKVQKKVGNMSALLEPGEITLMNTACGIATADTDAPNPGPAMTVQIETTLPFMVEPGLTLQIMLILDTVSYTVTHTSPIKQFGASFLNDFFAKIHEQTPVYNEFAGVTDSISTTTTNLMCSTEIIVNSYGTILATPGEVAITKADATEAVQGYLDVDGYFAAGAVVTVSATGTPSGAQTAVITFTEALNPQDAADFIAAQLDANDWIYVDQLASGFPLRLRFFATDGDSSLVIDSVVIS